MRVGCTDRTSSNARQLLSVFSRLIGRKTGLGTLQLFEALVAFWEAFLWDIDGVKSFWNFKAFWLRRLLASLKELIEMVSWVLGIGLV